MQAAVSQLSDREQLGQQTLHEVERAHRLPRTRLLELLLISAAQLFHLLALSAAWFLPRAPHAGVGSVCAIAAGFAAPQASLLLLFFALPFFGNKPHTPQFLYLVTLTAGVLIGIGIRRLRFKRRSFSLGMGGQALLAYTLVSILSLAALPLPILLKELLSRFPDFRFATVAYSGAYLLEQVETRPGYTFLSVGLTLQALCLALIVLGESRRTPRFSLRISWMILLGTLAAIVGGLLDYHGLISLGGLRRLDPVVNPGGVQFRLQSFFGHSGWFAEYVTLGIPFAMLVLLARLPFAVRLTLLLAVMVLAEYALVLSYQRGAWISYPLTLLVMWGAVYLTRSLERRQAEGGDVVGFSVPQALRRSALKLAISLPLTLFLTFAAVAWFNGTPAASESAALAPYVQRFKDIGRTSDRTEFFIAGMKLGSLHPFLGGGSESFGWRFEQEFQREGGAFYGQADLPLHGSAHNVYAQTFSGKGIAGLGLLLLLLWVMIGRALSVVLRSSALPFENKLLLLIGACVGCAFLIYGNVQEIFYVHSLQLLFFGAAAVVQAAAGHEFAASPRFSRKLWWAVGLLFVGHLIWEYAFPGALRQAQAVERGYGCYGSERDEKGRRFNWCAARALRAFPVEVLDGDPHAVLRLRTYRLGTPAGQGAMLSVEAGDVQLAMVELKPEQWHRFEIPLPEAVRTQVRDGKIFLKLVTSAGVIPVRDLRSRFDYRVLSYRAYE